MDQPPGPTIARTAPRTAGIIRVHGSPACEKYRKIAIQTVTMAAIVSADSDDLQDDRRQGGCCKHAGDAKMNERSACKQPQKQKAGASPTVRETRN